MPNAIPLISSISGIEKEAFGIFGRAVGLV